MKDIRRATRRGATTDEGFWVAETPHLVQEALRSPCRVAAVVASESTLPFAESLLLRQPHVPLWAVPDTLFASLVSTDTDQGVLALIHPPVWDPRDLLAAPALVAVLDGVQDPGNAGTLLRSAEAFGGTGVVFLKGSVAPHHPKTLRASAGSLFRLPHVSGWTEDGLLSWLRATGLPAYAAAPAGGTTSWDIDWRGPAALAIGSEGKGVRPALQEACIPVHIPTQGVESLNAGVAGALLLYEAHRQRRRHA